MRTVRLAKVAAQAEKLRLQSLAGRTVTRLVLGAVATVFLIGALIAGHLAIGISLAPRYGLLDAVMIIGSGDLLIAIVLGLLAALKGPGRIEREALAVRQSAQMQLREAATFASIARPLMGLAVPIARAIGGKKLFGLGAIALLAQYLGGRR